MHYYKIKGAFKDIGCRGVRSARVIFRDKVLSYKTIFGISTSP
jgi:hypothetical protein